MSTTETQAVPTGTWAVDKVHSNIGFAVDYMAGTFTGSFDEFDAELNDGALKGSAKVASVQVKDPNLEAHLQSPDFFDAERNPELTFESKSIDIDGETAKIDGEITIKGHTEPVAITGTFIVPFLDPFGNTRFGLGLEATIDRTAFGVRWNNPLANGMPALSHEVTIIANLQFVRQG
jgi:polyisoprenoid-binding protein YceI